MKLNKALFALLFISLAYALTCEEDKKCCQIVRAERFYSPLEGWYLFWVPTTYISSHHFLLLTLEDESILFLELGGEGRKKGKEHLICSTQRAKLSDDYTPTNITSVSNRISVSQLKQYCEKFLTDKRYNWASHLTQNNFLGNNLGEKEGSACLNCITLANYLWGKLTEKSLSYLSPSEC